MIEVEGKEIFTELEELVDPAYAALLVVDMQRDFCEAGYAFDRLGVDIAFETPDWEVLTAGSWNGRWDFSVGSMTITSPRQEVLDFTQPYYYTPAQLAVDSSTGITTPEGLAGKTICVGEGTTFRVILPVRALAPSGGRGRPRTDGGVLTSGS